MEKEYNHHKSGIFLGILLLIIIIGVVSWFAWNYQTVNIVVPQEPVIVEKQIEIMPEEQKQEVIQEESESNAIQPIVSQKKEKISEPLLNQDPSFLAKRSLAAAMQYFQMIPYSELSNPALVKYKWAMSNLAQASEARKLSCADLFFNFDREAIQGLSFLACVPLEDSPTGGKVTYDKSIVAFRVEDESKYASIDFDDTGYLTCPNIRSAEQAIIEVLQSEEYMVVDAIQAPCVDERAREKGEYALTLARQAFQEKQYLKASWNYRNAWDYVITCQC